MRMLILGDFSGRADVEADARAGVQLQERPIMPVDVDSFEALLARLAPRLEIAVPGADALLTLTLRSLDHFRPESLYARLALFAPLRELRGHLLDPAAFASAAAELQALLGGFHGLEVGAGEGAQVASAESDAQAIGRLLGRSTARCAASGAERPAQAVVSELIRQVVAPYVVPEQAPHLDLYLRALDAVVVERMRGLLHAPAFQAMESRWRSLHYLVTNLEIDEGLQVHLLDVSRQELAADLASAGGDLRSSGLYRLLVERTGPGTPGGEPWSLLVGCFDIGPSAADLGLLADLGVLGACSGGPFLAAAAPGLVGCRSLAETPYPSDWGALSADAEAAWLALRQSPIAPWIGLALPRVLLRLPYGQDAEPIDGLAFEELGPERPHEAYLWGSPACLCALLIGQAYTASGWAMAPGDLLDLGDLPAHVYEEDGEQRLQACAEVYLTERAAEALLDRGLMPLLSLKGRNQVRLARFQSIASPPAALSGPWGG